MNDAAAAAAPAVAPPSLQKSDASTTMMMLYESWPHPVQVRFDDLKLHDSKEAAMASLVLSNVVIDGECELEMRLGRCSLMEIIGEADDDGSYRQAQPISRRFHSSSQASSSDVYRTITSYNQPRQDLPRKLKYDGFNADVEERTFLRVIESLDPTLSISSQTDIFRHTPSVLAHSCWHRREELTTYFGPDATHEQFWKCRTLVDEERGTYFTICANAFDLNDKNEALWALMDYLHVHSDLEMSIDDQGDGDGHQRQPIYSWRAYESPSLPDPVIWLKRTVHHDGLARQPLRIEKTNVKESILGSVQSSSPDIKVSICQEVDRRETLPQGYLYACNAQQRVDALISSHQHVYHRSSVAAVAATTTIIPSTGENSSFASVLNAVTSELVEGIIMGPISQDTEVDAMADLRDDDEDDVHAHGQQEHRSSLVVESNAGQSSLQTPTSTTTAAAAAAASATPPPPTAPRGRGRPPKNRTADSQTNKKNSSSSSSSSAMDVVISSTTASAVAAAAAANPISTIPPVYRIKSRRSFILGPSSSPPFWNIIQSMVGHDEKLVDKLMCRPLFRVDLTRVWQYESMIEAKRHHANYITSTLPSSEREHGDQEKAAGSRPRHEVEIELIDPSFWTDFLVIHLMGVSYHSLSVDFSLLRAEAVKMILQAMASFAESIVGRASSSSSSSTGADKSPLWIHRDRFVS